MVKVSFIRALGTQYYDNGDKYEGKWRDDHRTGRGSYWTNKLGVMVYASGDRYEGEWRDDMREGEGRIWINY